ncbi:FAD-dependent oxidoreductase [Desulfosediminicola sp.]|uniref:glycerol-3-phosphate dehydrogenase/oxidase n=1 Tax=Desulfosediminicola sp. TaxID=2886825 RepID=UPI003AF2469C
MRRDIDYLANNDFHVVIIGGGIHGSVLFRQLAETGIRVALVEKDDFGAGTSANSLKILHGGLRYLQHLNIRRIRDSVYSRKVFMKVAPHLVQPLPCVIPTSDNGIKGKSVMAAALKIFDFLSWDRNHHAPEKNRAGRGTLLNREQFLKIVPQLNTDEITGGALWYDDLIVNTERMCLSFVKAGCAAGGVAANYVKVRKLARTKNRISGAEVTDRLSGRTFMIRGRMVINAAGPWIDEIRRESHQASTTEDLAKAVNIVVDKQLFAGHGVGLESNDEVKDRDSKVKRSNRLYFFVPWKNCTIIGTSYSYYSGRCDELKIEDWDIEEIISEVNAIYPGAALSRKNVIHSHAGLIPAHKPVNNSRNSTPQLLKKPKIIDHQALEGLEGLLTVEGVKYTTAPAIALQVEKLLRKKAIIPNSHLTKGVGSSTADVPTGQDIQQFLNDYPRIQNSYGSYSSSLLDIMKKEANTAEPVNEGAPLLKAEVLYSIREEMAMKLSDVVLRRTDCGNGGCPSLQALEKIATLMADELDWNENRQALEVEQLYSYYQNRSGREQ